jgi:hypothetical protein
MSKKASTKLQSTPREIALEVPRNVNLVEMSAKEIDRLALDMARKATASLPPDSALLGVERVTLTSRSSPEIGVWGQWSRGCGRSKELNRDDITINPEVFVSPVSAGLGKTTARLAKGRKATAKGKKSTKKSGKKAAAKKRK